VTTEVRPELDRRQTILLLSIFEFPSGSVQQLGAAQARPAAR
jgi:hypothetical protein